MPLSFFDISNMRYQFQQILTGAIFWEPRKIQSTLPSLGSSIWLFRTVAYLSQVYCLLILDVGKGSDRIGLRIKITQFLPTRRRFYNLNMSITDRLIDLTLVTRKTCAYWYTSVPKYQMIGFTYRSAYLNQFGSGRVVYS